jgi:hypothetical protein
MAFVHRNMAITYLKFAAVQYIFAVQHSRVAHEPPAKMHIRRFMPSA